MVTEIVGEARNEMLGMMSFTKDPHKDRDEVFGTRSHHQSQYMTPGGM